MNHSKILVNVRVDFSTTPGPRYKSEGDFSGEVFREKVLFPKYQKAVEKDGVLQIILDGTAGYGTSFLEEAFGGLIRENGALLSEIKSRMIIISEEEPNLKKEIESYLKQADFEKNK